MNEMKMLKLTPVIPFGSHCFDCHAVKLPLIDVIVIKMQTMPHMLAIKMNENTFEFCGKLSGKKHI